MKKMVVIISITALVFLGLSSGAFCQGRSGGGNRGGAGSPGGGGSPGGSYYGGGHRGGGYYGGGGYRGGGYYGRGYYGGGSTTEEVATTMAEVRTSSLAGPSGSLTTPILTAIIRTVTPIPILTLTSIRIRITPLRMRNLRCMSNLSNRIPGITVGIQEGITRTSRVVLAAGQK